MQQTNPHGLVGMSREERRETLLDDLQATSLCIDTPELRSYEDLGEEYLQTFNRASCRSQVVGRVLLRSPLEKLVYDLLGLPSILDLAVSGDRLGSP